MIPAVVVLTRTSPGTAGRHQGRRARRMESTKPTDVFVAHSRSTNFCTRPSRANTATVSTMYTNTPILSPFRAGHAHTKEPHRVSHSAVLGGKVSLKLNGTGPGRAFG